jgi:hypothetical protein
MQDDVDSERHMTQRVRITVRGRVSPRLASAFEGMAPHYQHGRTDLVGEIADQSQLHAYLRRIRDLGLELQSVNVLPSPEQTPPPHAQT